MADSKENYEWDLGSWRINYRNLWRSWSIFKIQPFLLLFSFTNYLLICYWKEETVWKEHKLMKKLQLSLMESKMFQI